MSLVWERLMEFNERARINLFCLWTHVEHNMPNFDGAIKIL